MQETLNIEELLEKDGVYVGPTVGVSMMPMLRNRRDSIVVRPKTERLKPLDVALYKRGNQYVLHRVLSLTEDGYIIRGDNCYRDEYISEKDVLGVLTEFFREDKHILCSDEKYLRYAKKRVKTYRTRRFFVLFKAKIKAGFRKIFKKKG
ncbi:MAG: S24/S26 family peptidase [Clostridia bacterium]|nr:S24/S26 family peptidase [Clostridia bacterium]